MRGDPPHRELQEYLFYRLAGALPSLACVFFVRHTVARLVYPVSMLVEEGLTGAGTLESHDPMRFCYPFMSL